MRRLQGSWKPATVCQAVPLNTSAGELLTLSTPLRTHPEVTWAALE